MVKRVALVLVSVLLVTATLAGCGQQAAKPAQPAAPTGNATSQPARDSSPIKIGAILPLTGSGASYGVWMKGGAEIAGEEINAAGGIAGRKLEIIYEDHAADASKAVNSMRRLVEVEKVPFSLTSYSSPTLAVQPIAVQSKVVLMNGGGQSDALANKDWLYNNIPVVSDEVKILVKYLVEEKKYMTAGIIMVNDEGGRSAAKTFKDAFQAGGGKVLAEEQHPLGGNDYRAQLAKLKAVAPDVIYVSTYGRDAAIVVNQAKEIGVPSQLSNTSWAIIPEVLAAPGAEGMIFTRLPFAPKSEFAAKFKQKYNTDAGFFAVQYYNAVKIFAKAAEEAIRKNGKVDGEGIKSAIESIRTFDTISGKLVFQPNHAAVMDVEVGLMKGGKFEPIKLIKAQ